MYPEFFTFPADCKQRVRQYMSSLTNDADLRNAQIAFSNIACQISN
jgi:hypothetical protein